MKLINFISGFQETTGSASGARCLVKALSCLLAFVPILNRDSIKLPPKAVVLDYLVEQDNRIIWYVIIFLLSSTYKGRPWSGRSTRMDQEFMSLLSILSQLHSRVGITKIGKHVERNAKMKYKDKRDKRSCPFFIPTHADKPQRIKQISHIVYYRNISTC